MATGIPARLSVAEGRRFGLTLGIAFLTLAGLFWWRGRLTLPAVLAAVGALLVVAGLALPTKLGPVHDAWMSAGKLVAKVTNPLLLTLVFLVAVVPIGLVKRLFGRRAISRDRSQGSFWITRPAHTRQRVDMEHQF